MKYKLIGTMALTAAICLINANVLAAENTKSSFAERYNLRCYGPVTAEEMPSLKKYGDYRHYRISSRDESKAELLISKLISDFTTLPTVKKVQVKSGQKELIALSFDNGGQILPVLKKGGSEVSCLRRNF